MIRGMNGTNTGHHTSGKTFNVRRLAAETRRQIVLVRTLVTGRMRTMQKSFVCFFAESRSGRNVSAMKGQELVSPSTFWFHGSKY